MYRVWLKNHLHKPGKFLLHQRKIIKDFLFRSKNKSLSPAGQEVHLIGIRLADQVDAVNTA